MRVPTSEESTSEGNPIRLTGFFGFVFCQEFSLAVVVYQCLECHQGSDFYPAIDVHPQQLDLVHGLSVGGELLYVSDCECSLSLPAIRPVLAPKKLPDVALPLRHPEMPVVFDG